MIADRSFKPSDRLMKRLKKLYKVFNFGQAILNTAVAQLGSGMEFGEIALNSDGVIRQASIVAKEPCILAYLEKREYKSVIKKALNKESNDTVLFLKSIRIFNQLTAGRLTRLSY